MAADFQMQIQRDHVSNPNQTSQECPLIEALCGSQALQSLVSPQPCFMGEIAIVAGCAPAFTSEMEAASFQRTTLPNVVILCV